MTKFLSNISIQIKIFSISAVLLGALVICSGSAWFAMTNIGSELDAITGQHIPLTDNLTAISEYQLKQTIHFERALRSVYLFGKVANAIDKFNKEIEYFDELSVYANEEFSKGEQLVNVSVPAAYSEEEIAKLKSVQVRLMKMAEQHADFEKHAHQFFGTIMTGDERQAIAAAEHAEQVANQLTEELQGLLAEIELYTADAMERARKYEQVGSVQLFVVTLFSALVGGFLSWFISRAIVGRLNQARHDLELISSGDLTQSVEVDGNDEVSSMQRSMQIMHDYLRDMIARISMTASQLSTATEKLSSITAASNENVALQLRETEQVATAMHAMNVTVNEVAGNARETSDDANKANDETINGCKVVEDAVRGDTRTCRSD